MWFLFGFVTLICFCLYKVYTKINASWQGVKAKSQGQDYQYKLDTHKDEINGVFISIPAPKKLDFSFKKEGVLDRFFKKLGISVEHEIGNSAFDDLVYIVSDSSLLHKHISENDELVAPVLRLFSGTMDLSRQLKQIRCNSGRIWVELKAPSGFEEQDVSGLADKVVPFLVRISAQLYKINLPTVKKWRDPFVVKAAIILAISSGLMLNGFAHTFRIQWNLFPFTFDSQEMMLHSGLWAALFIFILIAITLFTLGKSSRTHLVLIELLLVGSLGTALTTHAQIRNLNMEMDVSDPVYFQVVTKGKRESRGRRSTTYYLSVDDWNGKPWQQTEIKVSSDLYFDTDHGDNLLVTQKEGYLGYRWVVSVEKSPVRSQDSLSAE